MLSSYPSRDELAMADVPAPVPDLDIVVYAEPALERLLYPDPREYDVKALADDAEPVRARGRTPALLATWTLILGSNGADRCSPVHGQADVSPLGARRGTRFFLLFDGFPSDEDRHSTVTGEVWLALVLALVKDPVRASSFSEGRP